MQGKQHMLSLTWNAPSQAFGNKDQNLFKGKTVDDIFIGYTSVYKFCGAKILQSFSCYDVMKSSDIKNVITRLKKHLENI